MNRIQIKKYGARLAKKDLPVRRHQENKTHGGKCLIMAGSVGKWGAAVLCAEAAARSGAGYVYLYDPKNRFPICTHPDFLTIKKIKKLSLFQVIAVGPGLSSKKIIIKQLKLFSKSKCEKVVLDAEALNILALKPSQFKIPSSWILTPHEGELSRLLGVASSIIRKNRAKYVKLAQVKLGCIVLLKGHKTLVASPNELWEIQSGNSSLAKAGTGDVLTGVIAAILSQGIEPTRAACLAAYIHGFIADEWLRTGQDHLSLMARDLILLLPKTLKIVRSANTKVKK